MTLVNYVTGLIGILAPLSILSQINQQVSWVDQYNSQRLDINILDFYHPNAGVDYGNGFFYGRTDIYTSLIDLKSSVDRFDNYEYVGREKGDDGHVMEIGILEDQDGKMQYVSLTGWRNDDDRLRKECEFIWKADGVNLVHDPLIDKKRAEWVDWSNKHQPKELVENVYSSTALYYNNGQLSRGKTIIDRYGYMNREQWSIELIPGKILMLSKDRAFEIGRYRSSGLDQYMLIWEKTGSEWRVIFDFNF